jgi:teichuronic acid biosynthesis glycosyltransferase TuaH
VASAQRDVPGFPSAHENVTLRELVVCSLESWDDIWRRNQFFTDALLRRNSGLRVLFVEPPADPLFDLRAGRTPALPRLRWITVDRRLRAFRPLKALPRKAGPLADRLLRSQVLFLARHMSFTEPTLWVNDLTYAPLIPHTRWPSLYDVTDDWLLAPSSSREIQRLRRLDGLALDAADEVVGCSQTLAASRGAQRPVSLVPNGVDVEHLRRPRPRPHDLPDAPVAVYVGSLHDWRIDVELIVELARAQPQLSLVFVGPNSLEQGSRRLLEALPNIVLLGPRPYRDVPGYLQHADVVIVPHRISPFTESLDPIKVYECLAIETPTVATPVAGFREHAEELHVVDRAVFPTRVGELVRAPSRSTRAAEPPQWEERALQFELLLRRASRSRHTPG